jgi:hypothetical protein
MKKKIVLWRNPRMRNNCNALKSMFAMSFFDVIAFNHLTRKTHAQLALIRAYIKLFLIPLSEI